VQVLSEGQCIKHDQYGFGIVAESDVERTTIDFDSVGTKKIRSPALMTMELVGEAPERPRSPGAAAKKRAPRRRARGGRGSKPPSNEISHHRLLR